MLTSYSHYHQVQPEDTGIFKPYKCHSSCLPRRNFFSCCALNTWNNVPPHIVESSSLNNIKANLDAYLLDRQYVYFCIMSWCTGSLAFCQNLK